MSPRLINDTRADADLLGSEDDVIARRFRHPDPEWLDDNYFHPSHADDWEDRLEELVALRRAGALAPRAPFARRGGALRDAWERKIALGANDTSAAGAVAYAIGMPLREVVRTVQRSRRAVRSARTSSAAPLAERRVGLPS